MKTARDSTTSADKAPRKIETRNIAALKPHPRQDAQYHGLSEPDLDRLAADIKLIGLTEPVEVTADDLIISGHQRVLAAIKLGWETIKVWVRTDLVDEGAIELRLIDANLARRQLDPLDLIRAEVRKLEIAWERDPGKLSDSERLKLRGRLAESLNMSERNVKRYLNILAAPMEVQQAVSEGTLPMTLATKVSSLKRPVQDKIAAAIKAGDDPITVVKSRLPKREPKAADPGEVFDGLVAVLEDAMETLDGREGEIKGQPDDLKHAHSVLKRFSAFSLKLTPIVKAKRVEMEKAWADLARDFPSRGEPSSQTSEE